MIGLKPITINNRTLLYKVWGDADEFNGVYYWTSFYEGTITKRYKKYIFFGKTITETVPKRVFDININIEDPIYTKSDIRTRIERKLELLNRQYEISNGEII